MKGAAARQASVMLLAGSLAACATAGPGPADAPTPAPLGRDGAPEPLVFKSPPFERTEDDAGVVVYSDSSASLIRVGGETRFPAPIDQVLDVLLDFPRHAEVLDRVSECRVLERGTDWLLLYQRLNLPVVSDRDFTLRVTWGKRDGGRWIRYHAVRQGPPPIDGVVRLSRNRGGWDLWPIDGGTRTLARYQSNMDLSGSLPLWMTRSGAADEMPSMFQSMCELLGAEHTASCNR